MIVALFLYFIVIAFAEQTNLITAIKYFKSFKETYNRVYQVSTGEEARRFACFTENLQKIEKLNSGNDRATYGFNQFTDLCGDEFKVMFHNLNIENQNITQVTPVPILAVDTDNFDWRQKGAVNPVKNQERCGSCWAFSTVCVLEGAWVVAGNPLTSFSEEDLIECATTAGAGCRGGNMEKAIMWVIVNGGIPLEEVYPYTSGNGWTGRCIESKHSVKAGYFKALIRVGTDESNYPAYLQKYGPLSVAVDALDNWQLYKGGIKTVCNAKRPDHGVNIVGYGVEDNINYWIVRNSWGPLWGENGYIRLIRGINCDLITLLVNGATVN